MSLHLTVSPNFAPEPATLRITVRGIKGSEVCIEVDGPTYYTLSCRATEGYTNLQLNIPRVPAGHYAVQAKTATQTSQPVEVTITKVGPP